MDYFLKTPIEYLKGVGVERGKKLRGELNVDKLWDLLNIFPFRYVDRSSYNTVSQIPYLEGQTIQLKGYITGIQELKTGKTQRLQATFQDETGKIDLVWFRVVN